MKARELLLWGQEKLRESGIPDWDYDSRCLFEWTCKMNRTDLIIDPLRIVEKDKADAYRNMIEKRAAHEPLQYLMGECEFMGLPFYVNPNVLIPRQDTEVLVEWMLDNEKIHWQKELSVLDVCTGSGCIAISFSLLWKEKGYRKMHAEALDISEKALATAIQNKERNQADVTFFQSDMFQYVDKNYDIIVSNPPYIPSKVVDGLMEEVAGHEPRLALDGKEDGLYFYCILAKEGYRHLKEGGRLYLEIGHDQGVSVPELLEKAGFTDIKVKKDLAGNDRCVYGIRKSDV